MTLLGQLPETKTKIITGKELGSAVSDMLFNIPPEDFEHFVTHLLSIIGFEAATTQYIGDKGVDVIGTLNPEGLTNITLKAQVRRVKGSIGIKEILMLRGTLAPDEHGVFIATSD